jgi:hypothetical protein
MEIEHLGPALGHFGIGIGCLGMGLAAHSQAGDFVLWRFGSQQMGRRPLLWLGDVLDSSPPGHLLVRRHGESAGWPPFGAGRPLPHGWRKVDGRVGS